MADAAFRTMPPCLPPAPPRRLLGCSRLSITCTSRERGSGLPSSSSSSSSGSGSRLHASRRTLLQGAAGLPLLLDLLRSPAAAEAAPAAAPAGLRYLTPAEKAAVDAAFAATLPKAKGPVMLRLVFHDAATFDAAAGDGGLNASVRLELARPENTGLKRGWGVIAATVTNLKGTAAEGRVGLADLVALAGAHAVRVTGGPDMLARIPVGRRDAEAEDPPGRMPEETLSAVEQLRTFGAKGFSPQEMVALLGSHTLGTKGFGDPVTFDNTYFQSLLKRPWENKSDSMAAMIGLASDHVLPDDPTCLPYIQRYAADQAAFFADFEAAYIKMTCLGAVPAA